MNNQNITFAFTVDQTPREVYEAVNNVRGWWSEEIEGTTDAPGGQFNFHYKDQHRSTQEITEMVPDKKVVWYVTDSSINFVEDKTEWIGTNIVFEIEPQGDKTQLRFTHIGLNPAVECYSDCNKAWGYYVKDSLRQLITTGQGIPEKKEL